MTIYDPSGVVVYEAPITTSATIKRQLMGDYYIELVFDAVDRIDVGRGCYILYNNHRFEIMSNVIPDDTSQGGLRYTLRFEAQQSQMKRCKVFWRDGETLEVSFALTSDISTFGQLIIDNVNAFLGGSTFTLGSVPSDTEMKAISFAGDSCWGAVATIAETFGVEWWTEEDGDNVRLCFGKLETGDSVEFRKGDIVSSIPSKKGDDASYGTRFYVFGSTKNLPTDYGTTVEGGVTNNVVEKRLHLPNGQQYIDAWPNLAPEDVVEQVVFFDDVMPTNVETITDIHEAVEEVIPGTSNRVYYAICADSPFGYENIIEGEQMQANFTSGDLIGQTFDLEIDTTAETFNKTFRIVPKVTDKDALEVIPNANMRPRVGDSFILVGVELPQARVEQAENELLAVGTEYAQKNSNDTEIYDCPTNAVYCHRNDCNYALGQRVTLVGDKFGNNGRQSRIQGYEKKLYDEYQAIYTVGDNSPYSRLASLEKAIQRASYGDRVGLEVNIIRSKADSTIPSDYNVYSALASEEIFLSKRKGGKVKGHTDFEKGISMYGIPWEYDVERDTWTIKGNVIITKGLATYSALKEDDVLSVFDGLPIDNDTLQWQETENGKILVAVGGGSGGGLDEDKLQDYLDEEKYVTEDWVTGKNYALKSDLDTVSTKLNNFLEGSDTDAIINKWSELEVFLSGLAETDNLAEILSTKFDKTDFTKANIKDKLGIADWALAATNPSYTKAEAFDNFVSRTTAQDISVVHNFKNGIKLFGKSPFSYNATKDAWELDGNLVITKGLATYTKLAGFTNLDVMGGIKVDRTSIYINDNGELAVVGGAGGGLDESALADYLTTNKYATQTWVTNQKYFTQANFTKDKIKEALGISDWALVASKPSYAWSEITSKPSYIFYSKNAIINPTDTTFRNVTGYAYSSQTDTVQGFGGTTGVWASFYSNNYIAQMQFNYSSAIPFVRVYDYSSSAWSDWKRIALHSTFDNYVPLATAKDITAIHNFVNGVKIGGKQITYDSAKNALVLPFNVIVEGGLATYTKLSGFTNLDVMGGVVTDGTTIHINSAGQLEVIGGTGGGGSVSITGAASTIVSSNLTASRALISNSSGKVAVSAVTSTELGYLDGVTSAIQTQLNNKQATLVSGTNIKTINGRSILGSGNISISGGTNGDYLPLSGGTIDGNLGVTGRITVQDHLLAEHASNPWLGMSRAGVNWFVQVTSKGVLLGKTSSTSIVVDAAGNLTAVGAVTENSDRKLKDIEYEGEGFGLDALKKVKVAKWKWKDQHDKRLHIGGVADNLAEVMPEVVFESQEEDGTTTSSIAYGKAGFSIAASLIAPVSRHEDRIKKLEKNIEKMQNELNKLKKSA